MASGIAALEAQLARGDVGGARAVASAMLERGGLEAGEQVAVLRLRARAAELLRDPASGMEDLDAALALSPGDASLWDELGFLSMQAGRASRAVAAFRQSTTLVPGNARAWNNLGNACSALGEAGDAIAAFREAVAHNPDYALAWANLGLALSDIGARADAEIALLRALSIDPMQLTALTALGAIRRQLGRIDEAVALYARAAKHAPDDPNPALQLAFALVEREDLAEARAVYAEAERRDPTMLRAAIGARLALPSIPSSVAEIASARAGFAAGIEDLQRIAPVRMAAVPYSRVLDSLRWSNFLLAYHGEDDRVLQASYAAFVGATLDRSSPAARSTLPRHPRPGRRLRVGFLSTFFRDGTAGRYFEPWITGLDRERFEVCVYHLHPGVDALGERIRARADRFRHCPRWTPSRIETVVRADEPDVLVYPELGMDATTFALAALRMAPLQCAAWGHPVTSGHPTIDVFFTSAAMEPDGADVHYTERLVPLPGIGTRYAMPPTPAGASRAAAGLPEDGVLLLCPQSLFKIHPDDDALFARILVALPAARLVLFQGRHPAVTAKYLARLDRALGAAGIEREGRVVVLPSVGHDQYMLINSVCDMMLDTTRWSGGNTSLDAIAAALPVVTLPGRFMRARQSAGMLGLMGIDELVARDVDDYVRIAVRLAQDRAWRNACSTRLAAQRGRIFDDPAPVAALADALISLA